MYETCSSSTHTHIHFTIYYLVRRLVFGYVQKLMNEKHKFSKNDTLSGLVPLQFGLWAETTFFFPILLNLLSFSSAMMMCMVNVLMIYTVNLFVCINIINLSYAFDNTHFCVCYLFFFVSFFFVICFDSHTDCIVKRHMMSSFWYSDFWMKKIFEKTSFVLVFFFFVCPFESIGLVQQIFYGRGFRLSWAYRIFSLLTMM